MTRRQEYLQHLQSPEWQEQRQVALARTSGFCQFCGDLATQVHHVRYPKVVGEEHPDTLVPLCDRCHKLSHGKQPMETLPKAIRFKDNSPTGMPLKYLIDAGRVFASADSWIRALQVPKSRAEWFRSNLATQATLKKDFSGGSLQAECEGRTVYRWHAVDWALREFVSQFREHGFRTSPPTMRQELEEFHRNCNKLFAWGQELQERAFITALRGAAPPAESTEPVTAGALVAVVEKAIAPRIRAQDDRIHEQDVVIGEIKRVTPVLRPRGDFITVKQAILEQGYDANEVPLPHSGENLSGLAGQLLKQRGVTKGPPVVSRGDSQSMRIGTGTYSRGDIYDALAEIMAKRQPSLPLRDAS